MPKGGKMMGPMMDPRSRFFMALASDQRLKILELLKDGEKGTSEIIESLGLDSSVVSRHLMLLRNFGLVNARKEGVNLFYTLADKRVLDIIEIATQIIKDWFKKHQNYL